MSFWVAEGLVTVGIVGLYKVGDTWTRLTDPSLWRAYHGVRLDGSSPDDVENRLASDRRIWELEEDLDLPHTVPPPV